MTPDGALIYELMTGVAEGGSAGLPEIADEFGPGGCCQAEGEALYQEMARLEGQLTPGQWAAVERMIGLQTSMTRRLCLKMYEYGRLAQPAQEK